ncbi:MAG: hypothetical protein V4671_20280, partial [Armatimonadota bacterium]
MLFPALARAVPVAGLVFALLVPMTTHAQDTPPPAIETFPALYSESDKAKIVEFWNQPGAYVVGVRAGEADGPVVARLTPEASVWLRGYNNLLRPGKQPPTQKRVSPITDTDASKRWEAWVVSKLNHDRWQAQRAADFSNAQIGISVPENSVPQPPLPGLIPPDLLAAAGNPPPMAAPVLPRRYTVTFPGEAPLVYSDNIALGSSRNPSYRFAQGVISFGLRLRDWDKSALDTLFGQVGLTPFEQNVVKAVSVLEGGFDSINTYDTGYVSVGFIQFATLGGGAGSLGAVLKRERDTSPRDFDSDFRRYGVTVDDTGTLVVVDPQTGAELRGTQAIYKIIDDKRLIAVFQRAGRTKAFQIAQIQIAKQNYYPADDEVIITLNGADQVIKVSDVIKSEAGMATLFDRKVNTGNIRILGGAVTKLIQDRGLTDIKQVSA